MKYNYNILNNAWFNKNQKFLLIIFNIPILGKLLRWYCGFPQYKDMIAIMAHAFCFEGSTSNKVKTSIYSGNYVARRLVQKFTTVFIIMHILDMVIDRIMPEYSFGFDKFSSPPGSSCNVAQMGNGIDSAITRNAQGSNADWDEIRDVGIGTVLHNCSATSMNIILDRKIGSTDGYQQLGRCYVSYNMTFVPDDSTVSDQVLKIYVIGMSHGLNAGAIGGDPCNRGENLAVDKWYPTAHIFGYNGIVAAEDWFNWAQINNSSRHYTTLEGFACYTEPSPPANQEIDLDKDYIEDTIAIEGYSWLGYVLMFYGDFMDSCGLFLCPGPSTAKSNIEIATVEHATYPAPALEFEYAPPVDSQKFIMMI